MDAQMLKVQKRASSFGMNIKFVRSVLLGPSTTNHDSNPQMGCVCYYCKKHWQKMGGPPCYKRPRYVLSNLTSLRHCKCQWEWRSTIGCSVWSMLFLSDFNPVPITLLFQCCPRIVWSRALDRGSEKWYEKLWHDNSGHFLKVFTMDVFSIVVHKNVTKIISNNLR